jgi:hypothetical protein
MHFGVFAYNETPTNAVAIACWFWARHHMTRPFLCACDPVVARYVLLLSSLFF